MNPNPNPNSASFDVDYDDGEKETGVAADLVRPREPRLLASVASDSKFKNFGDEKAMASGTSNDASNSSKQGEKKVSSLFSYSIAAAAVHKWFEQTVEWMFPIADTPQQTLEQERLLIA